MCFPRRSFAMICLFAITFAAAPASAQATEADKLFDDFAHYVLVARPDLASGVADQLMQVDPAALLDAVEASDRKNLDAMWARATRMPTLGDTAKELQARIQQERIARSRDKDRIAADVQALGQGRRHYLNAVQRLKGAGQFAAPQLLAALIDPGQRTLHPFVMSAMVDIGQPMVYPLAEALPQLDPVPMSQVGRVLGEIGYPTALPAITTLIEDPATDKQAAKSLAAAKTNILKNVAGTAELTGAELYYTLGLNEYEGADDNPSIAGYDDGQDPAKGIVWEYTTATGLVPIPVPGQVYGDVLAMRSSAKALKLAPDMESALTLWVMANLRRENRLGEDTDPSYAADRQDPMFYAKLSGPQRLHEVLARALNDNDPDLALDAIEALQHTASYEALVNTEGTAQPLVDALSYPDRRVRYNAAFALAGARPTESFAGSFRVVPVLAQAVRQTDDKYALVIADDTDTVNTLNAALKELGYETLSGTSMEAIGDQMKLVPGMDLIVTALPVEGVEEVYRQTLGDYKLAAVPMLAVTTPGGQATLAGIFPSNARVNTTVAAIETDALTAPVEAARASAVGIEIDGDPAAQFALTALEHLRDISLTGGGEVFQITDAHPALLAALADDRDEVAVGAAAVLAINNQPDSQSAILAVALDNTRTSTVRLAALGSLAESAALFGSQLTDDQLTDLQGLVGSSTGELAVAAARALGANMPAAEKAVELIVK